MKEDVNTSKTYSQYSTGLNSNRLAALMNRSVRSVRSKKHSSSVAYAINHDCEESWLLVVRKKNFKEDNSLEALVSLLLYGVLFNR